ILSNPIIPIHYTLADVENTPVAAVRAEYSLDGGGQWRPAIATKDTSTTPLAAASTDTPHTSGWDTFASGAFRQSANVVFRIRALPDLRPRPNHVPGPFQHPATAASTFPFRVWGTQVQVMLPMAPASVPPYPALTRRALLPLVSVGGYAAGVATLSAP